jgi:hypothetical protein
VQCTVSIAAVASQEEGLQLASETTEEVLDRLCYRYSVAVGVAHRKTSAFWPLVQESGSIGVAAGESVITGYVLACIQGAALADVKTLVEHPIAPDERFFGLFRSAMQSASKVEQFLHLYHIIMNHTPARSSRTSTRPIRPRRR